MPNTIVGTGNTEANLSSLSLETSEEINIHTLICQEYTQKNLHWLWQRLYRKMPDTKKRVEGAVGGGI